jgi:hypothetical protein
MFSDLYSDIKYCLSSLFIIFPWVYLVVDYIQYCTVHQVLPVIPLSGIKTSDTPGYTYSRVETSGTPGCTRR